jgi:8-oxo-dGTP pyrophosphatase MutT (NUDIX family)
MAGGRGVGIDTINIVAALIIDGAGRVLLVRKRGTDAFMQPGGKRDAGEDDVADGFQYSTCQRIL